MHISHDETAYVAGRVAPQEARYRLTVRNGSGASEQTSHRSKRGVRKQIRTWEARHMSCTVEDHEALIYDGPALGFR